MPYVTMARAKGHLRITTVDRDEDIASKVEQASDIIRDYLKSRADVRATIETSSVASPTVIETEAAHGFVNGQTVVIVDHVDSVPDLNGSHVISNVLGDSFTVPIAVTVAGTGGTAIVLWTPATAPERVQWATLLMLSHLDEGDVSKDAEVWDSIRRVLERSRDPALA
jgi:hypothetical protein